MLREMILAFPAILFGLTFHEYSHAFMANIMGDKTAKYAGRLTLNPLPHIDILGLLSLLFFRFGWAKPVPINPLNMRSQRIGVLLVSIAGPLSNFILAFIIGILVRLLSPTLEQNMALHYMLTFAVIINLILAFFNLIPLPPLDGSKILFSIFNTPLETQIMLERIGPIVLLAVIIFGGLSGFNILWIFIGKAVIFFSRLFTGLNYGGV